MKIVTHNAKFHADDVFGVATLYILLGKENCEVIRTRDPEVIESGDYVLDVGQISDPEKNRFDHHQLGGAGRRSNGIEYASFGLIWNKFGDEVCGSKSVADKIEAILVQVIDAGDNGQEVTSPVIPGVFPFGISSIVDSYRLTWKEGGNWDEKFLQCVDWAKAILEREIKKVADDLEAAQIIEDEYQKSKDKRIINIDEKYDVGREVIGNVLVSHPEPIYATCYRSDAKSWQVLAVRKDLATFELRKRMPEEWGAKINEDLEFVTGVKGSLFCHRRGFMCIASTREAVIRLAEIALNA